jgi:hypothetical protein
MSIDAKTPFDKIQNVKKLSILGIEEKSLNIIKDVYQNPKSYHETQCWEPECSSLPLT